MTFPKPAAGRRKSTSAEVLREVKSSESESDAFANYETSIIDVARLESRGSESLLVDIGAMGDELERSPLEHKLIRRRDEIGCNGRRERGAKGSAHEHDLSARESLLVRQRLRAGADLREVESSSADGAGEGRVRIVETEKKAVGVHDRSRPRDRADLHLKVVEIELRGGI